MLKQYLEKKNISKRQFAKKIGISNQALFHIFNGKSPETKVKIVMAIKAETGLDGWDYLNGLSDLKKIILKNKKYAKTKNIKRI